MDEAINPKLHQDAIREKLEFYLESKTKVHILKYNKIFMNGYIIKKNSDSCYQIDESFKGVMNVFVSEIYEIDDFKGVKNE